MSATTLTAPVYTVPESYMAFRHKTEDRRLVVPFRSAEEKRLYRLAKRINNCSVEWAGFWTFTFDEENLGMFAGIKFGWFFSRFVQRLRVLAKELHPGKDFYYFWKYEEGSETGRPHFHLITNLFIPIEEVKKIWTYGYFFAKPVTTDKIGNYLADLKGYFAKPNKYKHWNGGRTWSCSRNIPAETKESEWDYVDTMPKNEAFQWAYSGEMNLFTECFCKAHGVDPNTWQLTEKRKGTFTPLGCWTLENITETWYVTNYFTYCVDTYEYRNVVDHRKKYKQKVRIIS